MGQRRQGSGWRTNGGNGQHEGVSEWRGGPRRRWAWHPSSDAVLVPVSSPVVDVSTGRRGKGKTHKDFDKHLPTHRLSAVVVAQQRTSRGLKRLDDSPCGNVAPKADGNPGRKHWLVRGEKEVRGCADAEAHSIEGCCDGAGDSEE